MNKVVSVSVLAFGALMLVGAGCAKVETNEKMMNDKQATGDVMMKEDAKKDEVMMEEKDSGTMMKEDSAKKDEKMMGDEAMMKTAGQYVAYDASKLALAAKGPVVLFFHAGWCPSCKSVDAEVMARLNDIPANFTILKVDYDSSSELKKQYGVTYQHTFVQVDASGKMLKKWSGSASLADIVAQTK